MYQQFCVKYKKSLISNDGGCSVLPPRFLFASLPFTANHSFLGTIIVALHKASVDLRNHKGNCRTVI